MFLQRWLKNMWQDESAQGITEYGAIIAFVAIIVSITFGLSNGSLMPAVSQAFSSVTNQLNTLSSESGASS